MDDVTDGNSTEILAVLLLTRGMHFASVFVLFGSALYWLVMPDNFPRARRATDQLLRMAAPTAAISGVGWLCAIVANMAGGLSAVIEPETLSLFFFQTQFGPVAALRVALLAGCVVAALWSGRGRLWLIANLALGALLLVDQAWLGHAAEGGAGLKGALMIGVYCIHVFAAAAWLGGLPPLLFTLRDARESGEAKARRLTIDVLLRFSVMGAVGVALIVVSGIGNGAFRVGSSFAILLKADYGDVLFVKAALVAAMLGLAACNRFIALPRLRLAPADAQQTARLHVSVAIELVLGLGVLAAASVLGITLPPQ
ncbi:hypothetical protein CCR94_23025 [Rhodoblastus sphagnicola]|uniref:Copper resistance protein D domain-containing protein n=1 Tax=Rhodoblastus sphagnicola TaxID=333368 RepID=A0A2S6MUV9_9HYPH|nr:copper homeostasis membrane protein CopD [Rhodoblastus sphagnicola]MBB4199818.1 putative copper resistance protein D [Rhodoblastus sphagnicola]PPQ26138.1 hypothetical protein CCR94_23025 [Rhodoblastus sphagnicola]